MKLDVHERYLSWNYNGTCWSQSTAPHLKNKGFNWTTTGHCREFRESHLNGAIRGYVALSRCFDTEDEEDMKLLRALMEL